MDEKQRKSISRMMEEIDLYDPILEELEKNPGDMGHLHRPVLNDVVKNYKKTIECVEKGKPFLASQYTNPIEILTAMDVHWYFPLQLAFVAGGSGGGPHTMEDLEETDKLAIPKDCCTLIRMKLFYQAAGLLPIPTAYLGLTEPCDATAGLHAAFMNHPDWRHIPVFAPDPPYHSDERATAYYADEIKRMVEFITKHTGATLEIERLREVVEETNKGYSLWMEYNELRRSIPTPHSYIMPLSCFFMINSPGAGDPEKTEWYRGVVANAGKRIQESSPIVPNQKIRLFWYDIQPFYFSKIAPWLEEVWGAVIAMDMISYCPYELIDTTTEDSMFRGLAKRAFHDGPMIHQSRGMADNIIHDINRIVKDYKIDGVIYPGHMGHKDMAASTSLMRDVCRDLGVPFLHIGMDQFDERYRTVEEIRDILSKFITSAGLGERLI